MNHPRPAQRWCTFILVVFCFCTQFSITAQELSTAAKWQAQLDGLQKLLENPELSEAEAASIQRESTTLRASASQCVAEQDAQIKQQKTDLELIGEDLIEPEEIEASQNDLSTADIQKQADDIHLRRLSMENNITQLRIKLQECRFLILRAEQINKSAAKIQQTLSTRRLSRQNGSVFFALKKHLKDPSFSLALSVEKIVTDFNKASLDNARLLRLFALVITTLLLGILIRNLLGKWSAKQRGRGGEPTFTTVMARNFGDYLPLMSASLMATIVLLIYYYPHASDSIVFRASMALVLFAVGRILIRWLIGPYSPGSNFLNTPELPGLIARRLQVLLLAVIAGYVLLEDTRSLAATNENLWALRALLIFFLATALIWLVQAAKEIPAMRGKLLPLRLVLTIAALASVVADFAGFRNLANHLVHAMLATFTAGFLLWALLWLIRTLLHGLVHGTSKVSYQVRSWMGMRPAENRAELGWIRLILNFALWIGFAAILISVWDPSGNLLSKITNQISQGIPIGKNKTLILKDILSGLLTFSLLLTITAWIKARLSTRWLRDMGLDRGSREAVVTLGGYVGFVIAMLSGLIISGVDFKGFAIVIGALSVGIGFGLQNIVNNFVSGLILLFERPIKSGDYVTVGEIEGVIRQIRIRSTEIETQERQTVIVPNSELVSTQVTNWVLHDPFGRLSIYVGVAYGSDTQKVKTILESVAEEHAEVLSKGPPPKPRALFTGFGDSSLDFELRVWIRQIEKRYHVTSDINFAIDEAFRAAGIEIPFPQRDLHLRSWAQDIKLGDDADFNDAEPDDEGPNDRQ